MAIDVNWDYPRETTEYVFFDELLINGVTPTNTIEVALTRGLDRPEDDDWASTTTQGGKICFLLTPQEEPGKLKVWVRVADAPERTVIEVGYINIT